MHKLQEIVAVIANATSSIGREIRSFIVHFSTRCRQSRIVLSVSVLPLSLVMHAQTLTPAKRFSFADLQHLQSVGDVQISPDGHAIVYSVYSIDIQHDRFERKYWIVPLSGARIPRVLPHISCASWSPDSHTLAVVNDSSGRSTVRLLRGDTLEVIRTFAVPSSPGSLVWSPDGKSLAFTLFVPEREPSSFLQRTVDTAEGDLEKPAGAQWAAPVQIPLPGYNVHQQQGIHRSAVRSGKEECQWSIAGNAGRRQDDVVLIELTDGGVCLRRTHQLQAGGGLCVSAAGRQ